MTDKKETEKWINAHKIEGIECLVPDIAGNARGKFIPADMFINQSIRMPEGILTQSVTGEFPDDYWDLIDTLDGDMYLRPDMSTARVLPWSKHLQHKLYMTVIQGRARRILFHREIF